jgi:hypothetical protein
MSENLLRSRRERQNLLGVLDGTAPRGQIRSVPEFPYGDDNVWWYLACGIAIEIDYIVTVE